MARRYRHQNGAESLRRRCFIYLTTSCTGIAFVAATRNPRLTAWGGLRVQRGDHGYRDVGAQVPAAWQACRRLNHRGLERRFASFFIGNGDSKNVE